MNRQTKIIRLIWEDPTTGDEQENVGLLPVTIGRASQNTIRLNSKLVSRQHARLEGDSNAVVVRDLGSTNGLLVNGHKVKSALLRDGDGFKIGPFYFTFMIEAGEEAVQAAPEIEVRWRLKDAHDFQQTRAVPPISIGRADENTITLPGGKVSRLHATIDFQDGEWVLVDHESTNGTRLNGQPCKQAFLPPQNSIEIGEYTLEALLPQPEEPPGPDSTIVGGETMVQDEGTTVAISIDPDQTAPAGVPAISVPPEPAMFPPPIFSEYQVVPIEELEKLPYPLEETTFLTIGGGIGSFVWVDHLAIYGANPEQIVAIGVEQQPYGRLQRLANHSQIPASERLRSNSDACPDNIWGWPGYAVREIWETLRRGKIAMALGTAWQIFSEPDLSQTYTPVSREVFASIDREAARIGWQGIWRYGRVRAIRKTSDDRYVVAYSQTGTGRGRVHKLILARVLHVAVGYPAVRFLPDLKAYRERTRDFKRVVNAYESHDHIYEHLNLHGGTVLVRGRGIVASRIIQRVYETRTKNAAISLVHLMRAPTFEGSKFGLARRPTRHHWERQPFNWPKACWGGDMRFLLARVTEDERDQLLNDWGGTTTSDRRDWAAIVDQGIEQGWYKIRFGQVERVEGENGKLATIIRGKTALEGKSELLADFIIDATGLVARLEDNPLLKDLVEHYQLPRNVKNRLEVTPEFEVQAMRNGDGHMYASGSITLGSRFAPVDSFLGLQYAAQRSADHLAGLKFPGLKRLNMLRSLHQWIRWARGVSP